MAEPLIWLPLNGDLRNNGLDGTTFINNASSGYTIASIDNGKTGKCYSFDGHNWLSSSSTIGENMTNWTIACWICPTELDSTWRRIGGIGKHIRTHLDISSVNYPRFFCSKDGTTSNYVACNATGNILQINTWYHLCGVVSDKYVRLYINGELISSTSRPDDLTYFSADTVYIGSIESGNRFIGKICDIRIYDTALSDYEIKLLSQGLMLHYPLDNNGRGVVNNIDPLKVGNRNCSTFTYDGINTWTCVAGPSSGTWGRGFSINDATIAIPTSSTWTVELEVNPEVACTWNCDINNSRDDGVTGSNDNDNTELRTYTTDGVVTKSLVANKWQKIRFSQTAKSDVALHNAATNWGIVTDDNTTVNFQFRRVIGTLDTTSNIWTPYVGAADTTVYDTSGFGNNSTSTNVTYDGDTARYTASSVMDGSTSIITTGAKQTITDAVTFCMWAYMDNWTQCTGSIGNCIQGGGWGFQHQTDKTSLQVGTGTSSVTWTQHVKKYSELSSGWHHFAMTYDGFTLVSYIDGAVNNTTEIYTTKTPIFYSATTGANSLFIGGESGDSLTTPANKFTGKVSDARVYCTALSAEDIKDLFDASAKIHRDGTMYAYSYVEV